MGDIPRQKNVYTVLTKYLLFGKHFEWEKRYETKIVIISETGNYWASLKVLVKMELPHTAINLGI